MKRKLSIVLVLYLLMVASTVLVPILAQEGAATVTTTTGDAVTLPPAANLDVAAYLAALVVMVAPVYGAAAVLAGMFNLNKERTALGAGVVVAVLAHATGIPHCVAPGGPILGYVWAAGAGATQVANRIVNPLTPAHVDASFSGTGNGAVKSLLVPLLLVGLVATSACLPMKDPQAIFDVRLLDSKTAAALNCPLILTRADDAALPTHDAKSARHFHELCDCWARADTKAKEDTCRASVKSYAAYEENR
jgi:hypothetical protein